MIKRLTLVVGSAVLLMSPALASGVIVYPAKDQQQQQAWANQQAAEYAQKQSDCNRAYAVCLTGRGYPVD